MIACLLAFALAAGAPAAGQDPPAAPGQVTKSGKPKKAKKEKKAKNDRQPKKAKAPDADKPAPDEIVDAAAAGEEDGQDIERPGTFTWRHHPGFQFGDMRLAFEAKLQEDAHSSYDGADLSAGLQPWELHRNRVGVKGAVGKKIDFEVEYELTEKELTEKDILLGLTPKSQWKDVDVNIGYMKKAQLTAGKFKVPFGLDELTGVTHNDFIYRSLGANYLAPGRDIGAMVHGSFFKHGLRYHAGAFQHDGDNARSKKIEGGGATAAGRIEFKPFRRLSPLLEGLDVGASGAISQLSDDSFRPNGLRARTVLTQDTFFEPVYVKGRRSRAGGDFDWTISRASLRGEYTHVVDARQDQSYTNTDLPNARYRSWYLAGTWILTGEDKARPIRPAAPLFGGGIGAVEVVGRIERLWGDSVGGSDDPFANPRAETIAPSGDHALTLGVNWMINRFAKVQFNAVREHVEDPDRSPVPNGAAFWSRILRLQLLL